MANVDDTIDLSTPDKPVGEAPRFGDYELLGEVGRGAMGIVYRARLKGTNLVVALKEVRPGRREGTAVRRFREEIEAASSLRHPHIVPIFHVAENAGGPYYTMALIEGGSLDKHLGRFRKDLRAAASMVIKIARAIHHAHQRRVLHRDLKPANVLVDEAGEPHVADFGLATRLDEDGAATANRVSGSLPWMAPEAVRGDSALSTAVDVWALGVILYELITGVRPFEDADRGKLRNKIIESDPQSPREVNRKIDRDLDAICRRCLAKDPEKRYESSSALAIDLERWLRHEPVRARWAGPLERIFKLSRRNPAITSGFAFMAILLVASTMAAISVAHDQEKRITEEVCRGNEFAARHVASTLLGRLNQFGDVVEATADDPKLHGACNSNDWPAVEAILRKRLLAAPPGPRAPPFATAFVVDPAGTIRVEVPQTRRVVGESFAERDYFRGAVARADSENHVYLSKVFTSKNDGLDKLAISVPFRLAANGPVWVLGATVPTDATLGLEGLHDERRKAVLLAPRETDSDKLAYVIVIHPGFAAREPSAPFPSDRLHRLGESYVPDDDYADPVAARHPEYSGRWLAGFAPVPDTDLIVLVQQPYEAAVAPQKAFLRRFADWVAAVAGLAGLFVAGLWLTRRREAG